MQSKQLSRNDLAVVKLDAVAIICAETWYSTTKYDDSSDVDQTLCKQKETVLLLYGTNGEKTMLNQSLDPPFTANKVRSFQNCHLCVYFNLIWVKSCGAC